MESGKQEVTRGNSLKLRSSEYNWNSKTNRQFTTGAGKEVNTS